MENNMQNTSLKEPRPINYPRICHLVFTGIMTSPQFLDVYGLIKIMGFRVIEYAVIEYINFMSTYRKGML